MKVSFLDLLASDFFLYALAAGLSLALVAGPLGSFIVWRRMAYFGDTLAHSALLGIAIGFITGSNPQFGIFLSCLLLAGLLILFDRHSSISTDTVLGILAHSTLAVGIVVLALSGAVMVDLEAWLFGALLTIDGSDLLWVLGMTIAVAALLARFWNALLSVTVHAELAAVEGVNVQRMSLLLVLSIALVVAVSMKIVGVLLITSLLIIPPAAARRLTANPETMALLASGLGAVAIVAGLVTSFYLDTPAGPTIVVVATLIFLTLYCLPGARSN